MFDSKHMFDPATHEAKSAGELLDAIYEESRSGNIPNCTAANGLIICELAGGNGERSEVCNRALNVVRGFDILPPTFNVKHATGDIEQLDKVLEELEEAHYEIDYPYAADPDEYAEVKCGMEAIDAYIALSEFLRLRYTAKERCELLELVQIKNAARGYYEGQNEDQA